MSAPEALLQPMMIIAVLLLTYILSPSVFLSGTLPPSIHSHYFTFQCAFPQWCPWNSHVSPHVYLHVNHWNFFLFLLLIPLNETVSEWYMIFDYLWNTRESLHSHSALVNLDLNITVIYPQHKIKVLWEVFKFSKTYAVVVILMWYC